MKERNANYTRCFYRKNHLNFIAANLSVIFDAMLTVGIAFILQQIMDVAASGNVNQLSNLIFFTVFYLLICVVCALFERHFRSAFIRKALIQFKETIFKNLMNKNVNSLAGDSTGRYISAFTNDITSIEQNYLDKIFSLITNTLTLICAVFMMLWYDSRLTAIVFIMSFISMAVSLAVGSGIAAKEKDVSLKNESFVVMIKEMLAGFSVIKSFKAESEISNLFKDKNIGLESTKCARRMKEKSVFIISNTLAIASQVIIMTFGAYLTITGDITVGVLAAFIQLVNNVVYPVQSIPSDVSNIRAARAVLKKIEGLFTEDTICTGIKTLTKDNMDISLKDVTFGYSDDKIVLKNISCEFKSGGSYAIVGSSGCGKSTLLRIFMGGCSYSGSVKINGEELREISPYSLYDFVTAIQQETFIFDSTLENNITMFKYFKRGDIYNAIDMAGLKDFIDSKGSNYMCGENGSNLSGGERQRLSIARGLLRGTPILLMDEITSALDNETAHEVENSVLNLDGFTRIVVTHRLECGILRQYDEILVMRDGVITERGSFDELMDKGGYFYSLYNINNVSEI